MQQNTDQPTGENQHIAPAYSREPIATMTFESPSQAPSTAQSYGTGPAALFTEPTLKTRLSRLLAFVSNLRHLSSAEVRALLERTRRLWLGAAGAVCGLIILVTLVDRIVERVRDARERRHELAVATVNPESLIARCGEPTQDVTKQVFPVIIRTVSYSATGDRTLVLAFSRTAEEKSDWVFLSMGDDKGSAGYETPDAKIAALPCLDSAK